MSPISTRALLDYLGEPDQPAPPAAPAADAEAVRRAAAVLAAIRRPDHLVPAGGIEPVDAGAVLAGELIAATGRRFHGSVMLDPEVRYRTLVDLIAQGGVDAALAANPEERVGPVQAQLEAYLRGTAAKVEDQTLDELDATRQVVLWLRDSVAGLPDAPSIEARAAWLRLLQPFESLAGDSVFEGRRKELDRLRFYVGVVAPKDLLGRVRSKAFQWLSGSARPALSIHGPGGVGKSALVARFMLEHTRVPVEARIPFAYLDFDRPTLDVADPRALVIEMLRQLVAQFRLPAFEEMHAELLRGEVGFGESEGEQFRITQAWLGDMLGALRTTLGDRPYLVVLDTFEEVQYRGEARAFPLWDVLDRLHQRWPVLRVVVAGRAPVTTLRLAGQAPTDLPIGDLDRTAALAFLRNQGVTDRKLAERVVKTFGGVPLSLKLVASLITTDPEVKQDFAALTGGSKVSGELVQGVLYDRVLGHIHDPRIRRLAHPGLVLRRVTPELILEVLNQPCELGMSSLDEAQDLFTALGREISLMTVDEADGSLVHRSDLRRIMLKLLLESEPARVEQIRRAAIEYYDRVGGLRAAAEASYHRLHLGEPVAPEVLDDPAVRASIQTSIVEFPPAAQVQLATLGFKVSPAVLAVAKSADRELATAAEIENLLPFGASALEEAQHVVDAATRKLDHASPLHRSAARVAAEQGRDDDARRWIERGLAEAGLAADSGLALGLLQEQAWFEARTAGAAEPDTLGALGAAATRHGDARARLLGLLLTQPGPEPGALDHHLETLMGALGHADPRDAWALAPAFLAPLSLAIERVSTPLLEVIRGLFLSYDGPFRSAVFPTPELRRALDAAVDDTADAIAFGWALVNVLKLWPYRVLGVEPRYGRRGPELYESAS